MDEDETILLRITSKGHVFSLQMLLPVLQWSIDFNKKFPEGTVPDLIRGIKEKLDTFSRLARENDDGTLSAPDAAELGQLTLLIEHCYKNWKE